jgi:type IV pilus assembly protein PilY1
MSRFRNRSIALGAGVAWALLAGTVANSQDTELFVGSGGAQARPNVLLVLDTSGSMGSIVFSQDAYDPAITYAGACNTGRVYWSTSGLPPACGTNNYFNMAALMCKRAIDAFNALQGGMYTDNMAQYDSGAQRRWENIDANQKNAPVECQDDMPDAAIGWAGHGSVAAPTPEVYPRNGNVAQQWTSNGAAGAVWGSNPMNRVYTIYSGNFLNYIYSPGVASTRRQVMQSVASNLVNSINGINIGLMRFNPNSYDVDGDGSNDGGFVTHAVEEVETGRAALLAAIAALPASGNTPLSETLYEAYEYMTGNRVVYGTNSVASAMSGGAYVSPMELECQKNHIVLLTDGEPTADTAADTAIKSLSDVTGATIRTLAGMQGNVCDAETYPPIGFSPSGGECLDELAEFMRDGDMSLLPGRNGITTHTIGFTINLPILSETAARGGGQYYTAYDTASLTTALTSIITSILNTQTTFVAPAVSVNSFNQTRNLDDLYFSVFEPTGTTHWPGNLKKYELRATDATIIDALGNPAIDAGTGFFATTARSLWSATVDGADIEAGGAASLIPAGRNVYTYLGNANLTNPGNAVIKTNPGITDALLNTGILGDPTRDQVIDYINGADASDVDTDGNLLEPRAQMGDPLHAQPVSVVYGPTNDDARVYFATNDGYLHSIDALTGAEHWAFLPPEFLGNQIEFFKDYQMGAGAKFYGIDGNLRVQIVNADADGIIEPGEKVFLFAAMRRGGDFLYALDITNRNQPRLMWRLDGATLPGVGQSWSSAMPTRIDIGGSGQNADKTVVVIGGGYDPIQDGYTTTTDTIGNSIYIVDSESGALLWHGSGNMGADKVFAAANGSMSYSIPADVRVLDLNGDRLADRMYAADMGGQVWRFDIVNGQPRGSLVNGGVIAQLGAAGLAMPTLAETRRFYYAPDVALASTNQYSYLHVGIGAGYRAHPNETANQNAFYALRDYKTFATMTQAEYDALTPIVPTDLVDVTVNATASVPQGSPGWRLDLTAGGGWNGEKVLAETRTFNNRVFVSTFRPSTAGATCEPALGTNRQYVMSLFTGAPVHNRDGSVATDPPTPADRYIEWVGAPPPETIFIFTDDGINSCVGTSCGLEDFPGNPIRTFWSQESVEGN